MNPRLSAVDFAALSPLLILLACGLLILAVEVFNKNKEGSATYVVALLGVLGAALATYFAPSSSNPLLTNWIKFDQLTRFFSILFLSIGVVTLLLAEPFFKRFNIGRGEFCFLLVSSLFGLLLIGSAADFLTIFLGIETLSLPLYVLCCYMKLWKISHESAMKYFLMGSLAAAFFLYGIALVYGAVGTTQFKGLAEHYHSLPSGSQSQILFLSGAALITLGLAFKAAIVPFHFWAPDVYDGAPTPVTAFMAVGTKAGAFVAFVRIFMDALNGFDPLWNQIIAFLAYPTLIYASFVAMRQEQLRRFFAYSGIANAGYLLLPLAAGGPDALSSLIFYLIVYAFATLGCFAVLSFLDDDVNGVLLKDLKGLFKRAPFLAAVLSICLLTLAGIPPTIGFFAKFYLFKVTFSAGFYFLVIVALLVTVLSAYYYLRIISTMLSEEQEEAKTIKLSWAPLVVGCISLVAIVIFSFFPAPLMNIITNSVR